MKAKTLIGLALIVAGTLLDPWSLCLLLGESMLNRLANPAGAWAWDVMAYLPPLLTFCGVVLLWWPLFRTAMAPPTIGLRAAAIVLGGVCLLLMLPFLMVRLLFLYVAATVALFWKPRLLLVWSVGFLITATLMFVVLVASMNISGWEDAAGPAVLIFAVAPVAFALPVGAAIGLPFARRWTARTRLPMRGDKRSDGTDKLVQETKSSAPQTGA